jgi:hypothetical protein
MPSSHKSDSILGCVYSVHVRILWVSRVADCAHGEGNLIGEGQR